MSICTRCNRNTETWDGLCPLCDTDIDTTEAEGMPTSEPDPADRQLAAHISARDTEMAETLISEPAVTNATLKTCSETERYLLRAYRRLNPLQRNRLLNTLSQLRTETSRHASL